MIYGVNFNGMPIPEGVRRKFRQRVSMGNRVMAHLVGVGQSEAERDAMLIQANNGYRKLHVEVRKTAAGPWYGIYVY